MARCKGCIHDNVCNREVGYGYSVCPHYTTADVVPKSEVKKIFKEFERLMENNEVWFRQTDEMREEFAKLEKKYTEDKKDEN